MHYIIPAVKTTERKR